MIWDVIVALVLALGLFAWAVHQEMNRIKLDRYR